jgi:ParB-like chromosome segregation protein Spo0J
VIWRGYKQVKYASIVMDVADVRKRSKATHVAELAGDIRARGDQPIHAVTVRASDKRLLCGRDRMAALMVLKAKSVWVHLVDCNDVEARQLELAENIHRRPVDRNSLIAQLVAVTEQALTDGSQGQLSPAPQRGARAQARKEVARAAGVTPAAVKKAEQRAAQKSTAASNLPTGTSEPAAVAVEPALFTPCIDLLGLPVSRETATANEWSADVQAALDEADKHLRLAQAALKKLETCTFPKTPQQQLYAEVHRLADRVRSHRPASICPWCKHVPAVTETCNPCVALGYVSEEVALRAPKECLDAASPVVMRHGQAVPYADAVAGRWPTNGRAAPAKKAKGISVELPDGSEADLTVEYDEELA